VRREYLSCTVTVTNQLGGTVISLPASIGPHGPNSGACGTSANMGGNAGNVTVTCGIPNFQNGQNSDLASIQTN
jgi:hypothetical protein